MAIANGTGLDVMEIDAASNTGVDNIREIIERSRFAPVQCRYKVYAIDECHMLSTAAFNALLKTLEEPPPNVVFVLATTDPQRVLSTIISRCQRFDFRRIPLEEIVRHLRYIATEEKININDEAITLIAQIANGGLRDAESLLDQLSLLPETITVEKVWDLVGTIPERDLLALLSAIKSARHAVVLQQCRSLLDWGREPLVVLQNLASFYLNLLIAKTAPQSSELVAVTETCWQKLCTEATNWEISEILTGQQHLKEAETQIKQTTQPRLWLEVTLLGLLPSGVSRGASLAPTEAEESGVEANSHSPVQKLEVNHQQSTSSSQQSTSNQPAEVRSQLSTVNQQQSAINHQPSTVNQPAASNQPSTNEQQVVNEEIWQEVINCLQPPTTKALLSQQCHLVSFQDSSAIVGISSAKLQKLHQGKVANIEAAFEKVCQRKIKVCLEVASNTKQKSTSDRIITSSSPPPIPQPQTDVVKSHTANNIKAQLLSGENKQVSQSNAKVIPINRTVPKSDRDLADKLSVVTPVTPPPTPSTTSSKSETDSTANKVTVLYPPATTEPVVTDRSGLDTNQQNNENSSLNRVDRNDDPDILQQAIEDLTQSFEGELVQLDSVNLSQFSDNQLITSDRPEATEEFITPNITTESEDLKPETTILNSPQSSPTIASKTVLSGRPDLSEYEDENDLPF